MKSQISQIFKALSDTTRIKIVKYLLSKNEISCAQLSRKFSLSQPTLSHHFSKLENAEIIRVRKAGTSHFYSIDKRKLKSMGFNIEKILTN